MIRTKIPFYYKTWNIFRLPPEERQLETSYNPMCEVFPKGIQFFHLPLITNYIQFIHITVSVAVCNYQRYGRGGGQETKAALCVLSLNMINDKVMMMMMLMMLMMIIMLIFCQVFAILWVWHCILILAGTNRIVTRSVQLLSHRVRYFLMKMMTHR